MTEPHEDVERELGLLLRRAYASSAAMAARVHPDLDAAAYYLLVLIDRAPGVRSSVLAEQLGVGRATISRQVRRLESFGLVTRRPDPQDSRGQQLELTREGADRFAEAQDARRSWMRWALQPWDDADVVGLGASLQRLNATLDEAVRRPYPSAGAAPVPTGSNDNDTEFMQ